MGKTRGVHETTPELRNRMVGMYEAGLGLREIAAAINCSQRTVKRWLNRFDKEGTVETRDRCGRKRATTTEQDEAIVRLATQTTITAAKAVLPALGLSCSVDTVRERLHKAGIHNWSPCRKHMQKIPLGNDVDGSSIQQAVWRPTGTQLGKKKNPKDTSKSKKSTTTKKKVAPRKGRSKDIFIGDGAPAESLKTTVVQQQQQQQNFTYPQENVHQQPNNEIPSQSLQPSQVIFANHLDLAQQPQPVYHHQNWPLDLVQSSHHYTQDQSSGVQNNQHLQHMHSHQELHSQPNQQEADRQICTQMEEQNMHGHHHSIEHQTHQMDQQVRQSQRLSQSCLASSQDISKSCSNSLNSDDNQISNDNNSSERESDNNEEGSRNDRKKKGGKVKGTLETSVEIRNRMIGMSEAGLSTLSIALAINRSERTVKRWLERWHKEGNVQTKERKGRRRITTKEEDEAIIAMATQHPLTAAKYVAPALGLKCSVDTIRERLHKAGIHSWKLGKKQGEGNAVHTVHLWQPSGNRPNKPKILSDKKKKSSSNKKRDQTLDDPQKRGTKKKKADNMQQKNVPPPTLQPPPNMIAEQNNVQFQSQNTMVPYVPAPSIMQPLHTLSSPPTLQHSQPMPNDQQVSPPCPTPMQPMGPIMQQRPDCRLVPTVEAPVSSQPNSIAYPSCMVTNNNQTSHMEQTDPLNYEPYIWSF